VQKLHQNARHFRASLLEAGLKPLDGETPIVPIIVGETADAIRMSELLLDEGIFVTGFGFPVVPHGTARLRCQVSAAHTTADLDLAVAAIRKVAARVGILK
jgi:glycine C-acetyltransferase